MYINYTMNQTCLPLELTVFLAEDHIVYAIDRLVEELPESRFAAFYEEQGRPSYHPRVLTKALLYAYSEGVFSGRRIEKMMRENLPMQWITAQQTISYRTINRFRVSEAIEMILADLYSSFAAQLRLEKVISGEKIFVDGTKFEANANKYTFVWKKSTQRYYAQLKEKEKQYYESEIAPLISHAIREDEQEFSRENLEELQDILEEELAQVEQGLPRCEEKEGRSQLKRKRRLLKKHARKVSQDFLAREEKYASQLDTFGERNSFSKTDPDATFMRMKDDHMRNGQLKPGYNVQIATENQFVLHFGVFPNPTDTRTLIPFLESYPGPLPRTVVADAGYGSEENLGFLEDIGVQGLVKYNRYEQERKRGYQQSDRNLANWQYRQESDTYLHPDGTVFRFSHLSHTRSATGYVRESRVYKTTNPSGDGRKTLAVNARYEQQKEEMRNKLLSPEGGSLFALRKVDVESVFGQAKAILGFTRFSVRGARKVTREIGLLFMANNLRKYSRISPVRG